MFFTSCADRACRHSWLKWSDGSALRWPSLEQMELLLPILNLGDSYVCFPLLPYFTSYTVCIQSEFCAIV